MLCFNRKFSETWESSSTLISWAVLWSFCAIYINSSFSYLIVSIWPRRVSSSASWVSILALTILRCSSKWPVACSRSSMKLYYNERFISLRGSWASSSPSTAPKSSSYFALSTVSSWYLSFAVTLLVFGWSPLLASFCAFVCWCLVTSSRSLSLSSITLASARSRAYFSEEISPSIASLSSTFWINFPVASFSSYSTFHIFSSS